MVNFVVSSTSVVFIGLAIVLSILYPENPSTRQFALALFSWFLALGPLRWLENRIDYLVDKGSDAETVWNYVYLIVELILIIVGAVYFVHGLA
jgi:hypothetical protein